MKNQTVGLLSIHCAETLTLAISKARRGPDAFFRLFARLSQPGPMAPIRPRVWRHQPADGTSRRRQTPHMSQAAHVGRISPQPGTRRKVGALRQLGQDHPRLGSQHRPSHTHLQRNQRPNLRHRDAAPVQSPRTRNIPRHGHP